MFKRWYSVEAAMPYLRMRRAFLVGAGIGVLLSAAVILTGTLRLMWTPLWQQILLFPGFVVGGALYDTCARVLPQARSWCEEDGVLLAGSAAVGAAYGLAAVGIHALAGRIRRASPR